MTTFHAIAAMSENRVIGDHGKIPWHIADDFRWFKHKTMGATLVMGRKTYESIGKPLPGRKTVVLSRHKIKAPDVHTYANVETLLAAEALTPKVWVVGGAEIYKLLLFRCSVLYLTRVHREVPGDTHFPCFEDVFTLHHIIHKTAEYQVELWCNTRFSHHIERESWPLAEKTA